MWGYILLLNAFATPLASGLVAEIHEHQLARIEAQTCLSQDAMHRAKVATSLENLCIKMCKAVKMYPDCDECKGLPVGPEGASPGEFEPPGPATSQATWDALLAHMDGMARWGRESIRSWEKKAANKFIQISNRFENKVASTEEDGEDACQSQETGRRWKLQSKLSSICSEFFTDQAALCPQGPEQGLKSWSDLLEVVSLPKLG
eukprot:TRINITY_DN65369_c0_g1_i1.p1 TRINITY_DN65369_c0_g1~~TRINITY_DN65369_c0_g1_i1.p1  ORF type:complete len:204 (-),score=52.67 TRINITY_DN65369_c0_g1_i1:303-914(-)